MRIHIHKIKMNHIFIKIISLLYFFAILCGLLLNNIFNIKNNNMLKDEIITNPEFYSKNILFDSDKKLNEMYIFTVKYSHEYKKICYQCFLKNKSNENIGYDQNNEQDDEYYCKSFCKKAKNIYELDQHINMIIKNSYAYKLKPFDFE